MKWELDVKYFSLNSLLLHVFLGHFECNLEESSPIGHPLYMNIPGENSAINFLKFLTVFQAFPGE